MNKLSMACTLTGLLLGSLSMGVAIASPAQAGSCQSSGFSQLGRQQMNCSGNGYTLTSPYGQNRWNDPYGSYFMTPNGSGTGSRMQTCRYEPVQMKYYCR